MNEELKSAFEKRVAEAKIEPRGKQVRGTAMCPCSEYVLTDAVVRGIPHAALNYKLTIRMEALVLITILGSSGRAVTYFTELRLCENGELELVPRFDRVSGENK